jgi:hypothetical protein
LRIWALSCVAARHRLRGWPTCPLSAIGDDVCSVLIGFNSGHYQAIDLSAWLSTNPASTLAANLGLTEETLAKLPRTHRSIVPRG